MIFCFEERIDSIVAGCTSKTGKKGGDLGKSTYSYKVLSNSLNSPPL